jgi:hypothetical protein
MPPARFELTAPGLGILCSILLSYGGIRAYVTLSSKLLSSLLSSFFEIGQIVSLFRTCMIRPKIFLCRRILCVTAISAALIAGCVASDSPLSISLYNPKTGIQRKCSAKESSAKDTSALSSAVETCARQLEARGFVRSDNR